MDSGEFAEWIAFYTLEYEQNDPDARPSADVLMEKFRALAAKSQRAPGRPGVTLERKG